MINIVKIFIYCIIAIFFLSNKQSFGSKDEVFIPGYYFIEFADKHNSPYSTSKPHEFLSEESILRRQKYKIHINDLDLPVSQAYTDSLTKISEILYTSKWLNGALAKVNKLEDYQTIEAFSFTIDAIFAKPLDIDANKSIFKKPYYQASLNSFFENSYKRSIMSTSAAFKSYDYGYMKEQIMLLNGHALHNNDLWGKGVSIALFDAGFFAVDQLNAFSHLWDSGSILGYFDLVEDEEHVFDSHRHGTMVLSVMAAMIPGQLKAPAPEASYWLIRTEDVYSEYLIEEFNWLRAAEIADSAGVYIINSSLGYTEFDDHAQNHTYQDLDGITTIVARAANYAYERGILVVNSAGNYALRDWKYIGSPADSYGALAVGATNLEGERAAFSSFGPSADGRVKPDIMAPGQNVSVVNENGNPALSNGTSFSAPLVASLAACLWQEFPEKSNADIKRAIIESSNRFLYPDSIYGYGLPDFSKARTLLSDQFEHKPHILKVIPNPIYEYSYISLLSYFNSKVTVSVYNVAGQLISRKESIDIIKGYNKIHPFKDNFELLSSGIYIIHINDGKDSHLVRAVKGF